MSVQDALERELGPRLGGGSVVLALSGGLDSMVLLDALVPFCRQHQVRLRAVHVHHGLSAWADDWQQHCQQQCQQRQVPLRVHTVSLHRQPRQSLEAMAREARYQALAQELQTGDVLVTGHHLDDQAETFLLAARRGAGIEGLSAMPVARPFAGGQLLRPLLALSRQQLRHEAEQRQLCWVEDDSNRNTDFDRNFLRHQVLPILEQRFAGFAKGLARSAELLAEQLPAQQWLVAQQLSAHRHPDGSLDLQGLPPAVAALLLRQWAGPLPYRQIQEVLRQHQARADAEVRVGSLGRFQGRWYQLPTLPLPTVALEWRPGAGLAGDWHLTSGVAGSTRFHPQERHKARELKKLWQEWGIPPWLRPHWPLLINAEGELGAVLGIALNQQHVTAKGRVPCWQNVPAACQPFLRH